MEVLNKKYFNFVHKKNWTECLEGESGEDELERCTSLSIEIWSSLVFELFKKDEKESEFFWQ